MLALSASPDSLPFRKVQTSILVLWLPDTDLTAETSMLKTYAAYSLSSYLKAS